MAFKIQKHSQAQSTLMSLPLELRHKIYDYLNHRGLWEERQVLRDYLNRIKNPENHGDDADQVFGDEDEIDIEAMVADDASDADHDSTDEEDSDDDLELDDDIVEDEVLQVNEEQGNPGTDAVVGDSDDALDGDGSAEQAAATTTNTASANAPPRAPRPRNKYRYVPYLLHLSACPPPANVLQICQRCHEEATGHYYDTNTLHLDVTKSFQHLTFLEETLQEIASAPFSPFESMRKVSLRFVWDSAYINELAKSIEPTDDDYERILNMRQHLEICLNLRINNVVDALQSFSQLKELNIRIYDSKSGPEEVVHQTEILEPFVLLCCEKDVVLNISEHRLEDGKRPKRKSILGSFRAELKRIVEQRAEIR